MDWLEGLEPEDLPYGVSHGKPRTESELYLANMVEAHPVFHQSHRPSCGSSYYQ